MISLLGVAPSCTVFSNRRNVKGEMVDFFLLVGGYDQRVGNQFERLSSCGLVILSEFLSPNFDLNCAQCVAWLSTLQSVSPSSIVSATH